MGIIVGAVSGYVVGMCASAVGANLMVSVIITCIVAGAGVVVWDGLTDWRRYGVLSRRTLYCTRPDHQCWSPDSGPCNGWPHSK